jgi:hypothetical protein
MACLQCMPFDEIFHPGTHPGAVCINRLALLIVPSILVSRVFFFPSLYTLIQQSNLHLGQNIILDFYILLLPISTVLHLQMPPRRKIAVLSIIAFGSSSPIIACLRLIPLLELNSSPDVSWVLGIIVIVASFEIQFAVIAVNLPSLKALCIRVTSTGSNGRGSEGWSGRRGYKLSSFGKSGKSRSERGSTTRLERGVMSTESEEELFRMGGTKIDGATIKVTKDYSVNSAEKDDGGALPEYLVFDH